MSPRLLVALVAALVLLPVLAVLAAVLWVRAWRQLLSWPAHFDEVVTVTAADGATVVMGRYRPAGDPSSLPPVVLCHGLAMNRRALAFDAEHSFARLLSAAGRDVWVVELRGAAPGPVDPKVRDSNFDTYAEQDVPAALAHVRAATGAPRVDWVGFSMGGMLAYAHLGALRGGDIRRLVTIGSPVRFGAMASRLRVLRHLLRPFARSARTPFGFMATLVAPLMWPGMPAGLTRGLRGEHYDARTLRGLMANTLADVPARVTHQFVRWIRDDRMTSEDGSRDYFAALDLIDVPTLVIAGSRDRLAPPSSVRAAYERIGTTEKKYIEVGRASGARADYDHLDLILGRSSREEVYPHVLAWLER